MSVGFGILWIETSLRQLMKNSLVLGEIAVFELLDY